ncbi:MAG TPA: response regulator [Pirellulales bacterium]|jgi:CheY-like chemotaxis protein|nr:response regulator [Pirellulales bacterium]
MDTVLIVDDSAVDRLLAGRLLEKSPDLKVLFAADGSEALSSIASERPAIVVTDLQMPVMNGLQLVETIRNKYPLVPVILMTAHGSEDVAVQALLSGAASYVPKGELARYLLETVLGVLNVARNNQQHRRLMDNLDERRLSFVLDNDTTLISPLVDQVQDMLATMNAVDDAARVQVGVALEEALCNAVYHGNLELSPDDIEESRASLLEPNARDPVAERRAQAPYCDRKLFFEVAVGQNEVRFVIRDSGRGFNAANAPDPHDPATLHLERGRGLVLIRTLMDDVSRDASGNELRLLKRRRQKRAAETAA